MVENASELATQWTRFRGKPIIIEVLSIVMGVLLALGVNEWNEDRIDSRKADEALRDVHAELILNQKLLTTVHKNNSAIVKAIAEEVQGDEGQFVPGLQIQDTAWKTMQAAGVNEHVEYEMLSMLSATYSFQEVYRSISYQMIQNIMSTTALATAIRQDAELPDDLFLDNMELVVMSEQGLLSLYERALEKFTEEE
jgi:hypothetical protein